jgi:RNA polymerase sigma factor (sigma-70 family)
MSDHAEPLPVPERIEEQLLAFAGSKLGPCSERLLRQPEVMAQLVTEVRGGRGISDAVLAVVHASMPGRRQLADEFAGFFLFDLMRMGKLSMASSSKLRRFLDTGDLVLSVFGDLWGDVSSLQFDTTDQFRALFARRMDWKASDQARRLRSGRRREDQRVAEQPDEMELPAADQATAPLPHAIRAEERERLILILLRLNERERRLLTMRLKEVPIEEIAREMELSVDAARKALERAIAKARHLAEGRPGPVGT